MQYFSFSSGCLAAAALVLCSSASAQVAGTLSVRLGATHISPQVSSGYLSTPSFPGTTVGVGSASTLTGGHELHGDRPLGAGLAAGPGV